MHCASTYEHSLFGERRCDDKRIGADMLYLQCEDTLEQVERYRVVLLGCAYFFPVYS